MVSRPDLLGDTCAADDVAALEHQHFPASLSQIGGTDQAVVASTNDNHVIIGFHVIPPYSTWRITSLFSTVTFRTYA